MRAGKRKTCGMLGAIGAGAYVFPENSTQSPSSNFSSFHRMSIVSRLLFLISSKTVPSGKMWPVV
jgi:hypothetical protein